MYGVRWLPKPKRKSPQAHGNLTLCGQAKPVTVQVTLKDDHYKGETTVKQTDFGIKPPGKAGIRAKDEVRIEFDVRLAS